MQQNLESEDLDPKVLKTQELELGDMEVEDTRSKISSLQGGIDI